MNARAITTGAQFVLLILGLFSGYLEAVAPVSDNSLQIVPGGIASLIALILLLLARAIGKALGTAKARRIYWLSLAVAASLLAVWAILRYADLWQKQTVEVLVGFEVGEAMVARRVKGTDLTDRAQFYIEKKGLKKPEDKALIQALGGIPAVWTQQSIEEQWRVLTRAYVFSVAGTVLALSFLAQSLAPARASSTRRTTRRRPSGRRKPRHEPAGADAKV